MSVVVNAVSGRMRVARFVTPHLALWGLLALAVAAFWPTLSALARIWLTKSDYQHGFVIAVISAVWLFKTRKQIDACDVRATPFALLALIAAIGLWVIAYRANSEMMQQLMFPPILSLIVLAAFGPAVLYRVLPPIAYLYFAIPIWDHLIPLLQWLTTHVAETVLGFVGVPTQVEGHHVTIPAGRFSIIEGCSGSRYFITGLAFAAVAAAMQSVRRQQLVSLLCAAIAAALITNWLRVVIVIYAGHVSNMQHYLVATEHKSLGYVLFVPMLLAIGYVARRLGGNANTVESTARGDDSISRVKAGWIAPAILLSAPVLVWAVPSGGTQSDPLLAPLPIKTGAWQGPLPASDEWQPQFVAPADETRASYSLGEQRVEVYLNTYGAQSPGQELVFHSNSVMPAERWTLVRRLSRAGSAPPMAIAADQGGERWVIARNFVVKGRVTGHAALAQLYYGIYALWQPVPGGTIAVATRCSPSCDDAAKRLDRFWTDNGELFVGLIPQVL